MKYIFACLLFFCNVTYAENKPWTDTEKQLFAAHTTLLVADWSQTRYIANHPDQYREVNPLFGSHPNIGKVDVIFMSALAVSYFWFDSLDSKREKYLITATIVRGVVVGHNMQLGLRIGF